MKRSRDMENKIRNMVTVVGILPSATPDQIMFKRSSITTKKRSMKPSSRTNTRKALITDFDADVVPCKSPLLKKPLEFMVKPNEKASAKPCDKNCWRSLKVGTAELSLGFTFPTGQSFRWKQTGPSTYTGVVSSYLFTLRQIKDDVEYFIHEPRTPNGCEEEAAAVLRDYLNLSLSLKDMWETFIKADARFAELAPYMRGARLLRQYPLECLFEFICSSNNNIQRITQMVAFLSSFGPYLGTVEGFDFHAFPSLEELSSVTEDQLRKAGFGYRAKYIVGAVEALKSKCGGGEEWLLSLRNLKLEEAVQALCTLPGIGPKVAACIALFALDQHHAIPVDTHVWQIATRYITPELAGESLTPKLSCRVSEAFVNRFGKYAGWAQTVLFIAELSSQQAMLPQHLRPVKETTTKEKHK